MSPILDQFEQMKVVPVVAIQNAQDAMQLADTLIEGGLPCAEITFRTAAAIDAMRIMAGREDILVGAGTVLKVDQVKAAIDVGARFMVSPGFNPKVVGYCVENDILIAPGICTPSDIEAALDFGLGVLKYFPAEAFGGLKTLKAMSGPYGSVKFVPTGGIGPSNLVDYLRFPKTLACGGTWIAKSNLISDGNFSQILSNATEAVNLVKKARQL
ncbi:MAG: bifunctional 4-hydroxy-2-oxoglutarate aldolase/2-dehydro-3-deoxy-phosphogluconate aldolase [Desulfobacterales bacterium]|nr:bifunctional 4-hydroxy-2-oxoglutarate aldolase/2-dehydro-3-deoxy-phosphogluconate aldolase [Desulfobacterales bacterium]